MPDDVRDRLFHSVVDNGNNDYDICDDDVKTKAGKHEVKTNITTKKLFIDITLSMNVHKNMKSPAGESRNVSFFSPKIEKAHPLFLI